MQVQGVGAMRAEGSTGLGRPGGRVRTGALPRPPGGTLFGLGPDARQLNSWRGWPGFEPSSERPRSIARKTCSAESNASRLQPPCRSSSAGHDDSRETPHRANSNSQSARSLAPADSSQRHHNWPHSSGGGPTTRLTSEGVSALGTFSNDSHYALLLIPD